FQELAPRVSQAPQQGSLRKAVAAALALDGESTMGCRKESRPKSIIISWSENEKLEEPGELEGGDQPDEEEADDFLDYPTDDDIWNMPMDSCYVTLTGTIIPGKKKGQMVDIHVTLTEKELQELTKPQGSSREITPEDIKACQMGGDRGPCLVLWTLVGLPVVFILSFVVFLSSFLIYLFIFVVVSFYYGTITWYNIFLVYNEERTFWHKISCCPCLILFYPVLIMAMASSLGLYAAVVQLLWSRGAWWQALGLEGCSPYSIVGLLKSDNIPGNLSNKDPTQEVETSTV
uniref:Ig-like domain-containing protein n=1 Tax=Canis lupus familiaris TaxID=9615 RepID=A0A8C0PKX1_CANLF